jgi:acetyltransferase-like isoleucine patch superfamily enzyme
MGWTNRTMLKIRRGEGPVYSRIRNAIKALLYANLPQPGFVKLFYRGLYGAHHGVRAAFAWLLCVLYREPVLRARCVTAGRHWHVRLTPVINGHPEIQIGDHLSVFGEFGIASGRIFDHPKVIIGNGVDIGHRVQIVANKEVVIEDQVNIASRVYISDTDAHPRDAELRSQRLPPLPEEVRPVRICQRAWLGQNCFIMKGVTIGEGAVIGANSVVITDIPPYTVAIGNPARVVVKGVRPQSVQQAEPAPVGKT